MPEYDLKLSEMRDILNALGSFPRIGGVAALKLASIVGVIRSKYDSLSPTLNTELKELRDKFKVAENATDASIEFKEEVKKLWETKYTVVFDKIEMSSLVKKDGPEPDFDPFALTILPLLFS